jgi:hypothetical protein
VEVRVQISTIPEDQERIRVLWRPNPTDKIREYKLKTVTYGVDCAPWQAIRTLKQLAIDECPNDRIKQIIGSDTVQVCQDYIQQIKEVISAGGFPLTKWASNNEEILEEVPSSARINNYLGEAQSWKTLGLIYNITQDIYNINVKQFNHDDLKFTKRGLLSVVASLYDPLGWVLPVSMKMRVILQDLWIKPYEWDTPLEDIECGKFKDYINEVKYLTDINIPRWKGTNQCSKLDLVGFSDASGSGYAAIIYSRVEIENEWVVRFIAARVLLVPLKLELP